MSDRFYANLRRELAVTEEANHQRAMADAARAALAEREQRRTRTEARRVAAHKAITAVINSGGSDEQALAAGNKAMEGL